MINKNAQNVFNGVSDTGNISMQDVSMQMKTKKKKKKKKLDNIYVLVYRILKTYSNGEKIRLKQKKNTELIKFWVDSISGRRFGNKTLYPLSHHRQNAFYSVFTIYIIND